MKEKNRENDLLYINHSGELLVWLVIILFIVIFCFFSHHIKKDSKNTYSIFMPDVDGLIVGSPVRMMGIEVGYVTKIKPTNDEVFVKFLIKDKNITIPQGTHVTVEFSGMAGSKSLELYLPDETSYIDTKTSILEVDPPKRLHDALGLLNEMFQTLGDIITTSSIFGKDLKTIEMPQKGSKGNLYDFLKYSDNILDKYTESAENFRRKVQNDNIK